MHRWFRLLSVITGVALTVVAVASLAAADAPINQHFQRTWDRTDKLVATGAVNRTWVWGPTGNTGGLREDYVEAPNGKRKVQYFDKSRMEINNPDGDPSSPFYVTNGLLVIELMTGRLQLGDSKFETHAASTANVAGDQGDPNSPSYADLAPLRTAPPVADGATLIQRVDGKGVVTNDPSLADQHVTAAFRLTVPGIDHQVAKPFWDFLNSTGDVVVNGQTTTERLFDPWFYATGYPTTEAYWATVKVGGQPRLVLMQCFERRCLTYTPGNPPGFVTEAGNVGQHYYTWRYEQIPDHGTPTATATETEEPSVNYIYTSQWGKAYAPIGQMNDPSGFGIDADGNVWVADAVNHRLVQFDEHGRFLRTLGSSGTGNGQFSYPREVAFGPDGRMYVPESGNDRVQIFAADGTYLSQFGGTGSGNGQFKFPMGVTIHAGSLYVADASNDRVQIFDLNGSYLSQFGTQGTGDGQFDGPNRIVFDAADNMYVSDSFNHRIQKFTRTGSFLGKFGTQGTGDGQFETPRGLSIDAAGDILVVDSGLDRVQKFTSSGTFLERWGSTGTGFGQFNDPLGLALDVDGNIYVADTTNERVQKFTSDFSLLFEVYDNRRGTFSVPTDVAINSSGNPVTIDGHDDTPTITEYTHDGIPLLTFGHTRNGLGQYDILYSLAFSPGGDVYVTDRFMNRVQRFTASWGYVGEWGTTGTAPGQFNSPTAVEIDADGNVYVADTGNNRVQKFDANGVFLDQWGGFGTANGQFNGPQDIAIRNERVYVTDYGNNRVQVFERDGDYVNKWGSSGSGPGQLNGPAGIALSPEGYVLVVDYGNNRVQVFSTSGELLDAFGSLGSGNGQFNVPWGITVDSNGTVYVTDILNHRVQTFEKPS